MSSLVNKVRWCLRLFQSIQISAKCSLMLLLLATSLQTQAVNTGTGTVSILNAPGFSTQRVCAQQCFGGSCGFCAIDLAQQIGCPFPGIDSCLCRTDLTSSALSILSSCVWRDCNFNAADISAALGIYSRYCSLPATVQATTTQATSAATPNGPTATVDLTSAMTATTTGNGNGQGS
jgi:hypothetical protein